MRFKVSYYKVQLQSAATVLRYKIALAPALRAKKMEKVGKG